MNRFNRTFSWAIYSMKRFLSEKYGEQINRKELFS
jgi:hypothetical protein